MLTIISGLGIGLAMGFVMQRGRFCMAGGIRDTYLQRDFTMVIAILIAISIQSLGLFLFYEWGWVKLPEGHFPWLATLVGGILFGVGMAAAGSCSTGAYYRAAEGLAASVMAVLGFIVASKFVRLDEMKGLLKPLKQHQLEDQTLYQTLGVSPWVIVLALVSLTLWLALSYLKRRKRPVALMAPRKTGIAHWLFEARWHPFVTALMIGLLALLAWPASLESGRVGSVGISGPSAQLWDLITTGNTKFFSWPGYFLLGLFAGAFIAARGSAEQRWRYPGHKVVLFGFVGGLFMGVGSGLAGGCMLGNALVGTAYLSWQGWLFIPAILLGSWCFNYFALLRPMRLAQI
ncbi:MULTISPECIES: YeeE/YedE family protein [Shewanella]|uniref:YeeE/YedE family protein n=1 Tax=Shewanella TaxID=22 RepID=UPI001C3E6DFB|nr:MULTISPECIES: YeeE/YedE family protein [unclassified Shewanella]QYJ71570.1 YeeE/YedE family protein [Shewanella sp. FJAT-51649]